jgi:hypothetical protein
MTSREGDSLCGYWSSAEMLTVLHVVMFSWGMRIEKKRKKKKNREVKEGE